MIGIQPARLVLALALLAAVAACQAPSTGEQAPSSETPAGNSSRDVVEQLRATHHLACPSDTTSEVYRFDDGEAVSFLGCQRRDGLRHGPAAWFAPNGALRTRGDYRDGQKHGEWQRWTEDGTVIERGTWELGVKQGDWFRFHPDGAPLSHDVYRNGEVYTRTLWDRRGRMDKTGPAFPPGLHRVPPR